MSRYVAISSAPISLRYQASLNAMCMQDPSHSCFLGCMGLTAVRH